MIRLFCWTNLILGALPTFGEGWSSSMAKPWDITNFEQARLYADQMLEDSEAADAEDAWLFAEQFEKEAAPFKAQDFAIREQSAIAVDLAERDSIELSLPKAAGVPSLFPSEQSLPAEWFGGS